MRLKRFRRKEAARLTVGAAASLLVVTCGGCSQPDEQRGPAPSRSISSTVPTSSPVGWESGYSPEQLTAYRQALARLERYRSAVKPIWAEGSATPEAKKLFMEYFIPWQFYYDQLNKYEQAGIRLDVKDVVLDSRASRVELGPDGDSVTIQQCVDQTASFGTQNGQALPKSFDTPQLVDVVLRGLPRVWLTS
jgi:hypothetical protein